MISTASQPPMLSYNSVASMKAISSRDPFKFRPKLLNIYILFFIMFSNNSIENKMETIEKTIFNYAAKFQKNLSERTYARIIRDIKIFLNNYFPFKDNFSFADLLHYLLFSFNIPVSDNFLFIFRNPANNNSLIEHFSYLDDSTIKVADSIKPGMSNDFLILFISSINAYLNIIEPNEQLKQEATKIKDLLIYQICKGIFKYN